MCACVRARARARARVCVCVCTDLAHTESDVSSSYLLHFAINICDENIDNVINACRLAPHLKPGFIGRLKQTQIHMYISKIKQRVPFIMKGRALVQWTASRVYPRGTETACCWVL